MSSVFAADVAADERARRRATDLEAAGEPVVLEQLEREIRDRDHHDATRATSPLKPAEDATIIDTTDMTAEEAVDTIVTLVNRAFGL